MSDLPSPPAALRRRAAADPESPFLFWPEGWNWRWWSWRQVAEQVDRWRVPLAGLPAGALVGFAGGAYPDAIPQDLAVQEAGMTAVPVGVGWAGIPGEAEAGSPREAGGPGLEATCQEGAAAGCDAWLEVVAGEPRLRQTGGTQPAAPSGGGAAAGGGDGGAGGGGAREAGRGGGGQLAGNGPGGVIVGGVGGVWSRLASADVAAAAARLETAIAAAGGPLAGDGRARPILVAGQPLDEWPARLLTSWAILAGAALVLQSDPALRLGTVRWSRPTVFHGSASEIAELRRQLEESRQPRGWRRRAPRPAFGRLRTLLQTSEPAASDLAFWRERGARLLRLSGLGDLPRGGVA